MRVVAVYAGMIVVALGGCSFFGSANSSQSTVLGQATSGAEVAYDVIKVDEAVVRTMLAHTPPSFHERFRQYQPPPEPKIAVGDLLSVAIWESSAEGLFGYSLWDTVTAQGLPLPAASSAVADIGTRGFAAAPQRGNPGGAATAASLPQALSSDVSAMANAASPEAPPGWAVIAGSAPSVPSTALPSASGGQLPSAVDSGFGMTPSAAQLPGMHPSALQSSRQTGVPSGLPNLPSAPQNIGQIGRPGTRIPIQVVGPDGGITVPYAGRIPVAGHTPNEAERMINARLAGKAVDPQALVAVLSSPGNSVTVAGEAVGGKRVPLNPGGERLVDVIAAAGGAQAPVHDTFVALSRDGVTATVPLARLVEHPEENIFARPGDVLTLLQRPQTFSVFGATGKNAAINFTRDRLSLSEALAQSGGLLDDKADPRAVFLFRYEPDAVVQALGQPLATQTPKGVSPVAYRFDLNDAKSYLLAKQFPIRDKDIVFVANAEVQPLYRFFTALQNVTGPVVTGFLVCQNGNC
jgi:polysaccharide export outer membrane protein